MNLLDDPWIQIKRANGAIEHIAPWQLTDQHDDNPIVKLATPRPDFNGSLMQFLIGILQTACAPKEGGDYDWADWLESPPNDETLKAAFLSFESAFNFDADGPKVYQDFDHFEGATESVSSLLIDAPGANSLRNNADHFMKRGHVNTVCRPCAAMALITLQTNAPAGGAGHRTSLRGGGPLTTLVAIDPIGEQLAETLWRNLWLNVLDESSYGMLPGDLRKRDISDTFPWMGATRTSDKSGKPTYPVDVNVLQVFWSMPRRIRIDFESQSDGICDICSRASIVVSHYKTKNYGVNYEGAWQHPLSPHRIDSKTGEPIPLHPQPGGMTYRHWQSFTSSSETNKPAYIVERYITARRLEGVALRLNAFGYDMDNMKARCWYESTFPLYILADEHRRVFSDTVDALTQSATAVAGYVRSCIKDAWFKRPGDAKGDTTFVVSSFFDRTEEKFLSSLKELVELLDEGKETIPLLYNWHEILLKNAMALFDYWAQAGSIEFSDPRRIITARTKLRRLMYGKEIRETLLLPDNRKKAS